MASVEIGDVLEDRYRIVAVRGRGQMGDVLEAEDLANRRRVALKVLRVEVRDIPQVAERLVREGRLASQLTSPHVVRVYGVGHAPSGVPFVVMELLEGRDLGSELAERGRLPLGEAVQWIRQACEALDEAHRADVVHRDVKPSNLFLAETRAGRVLKVLDFGVSKEIGADAGLTMTHSMLGTPLYMSPEQVRSAKSVDAKSDVWALGVVLFELCTGRPPFDGPSGPAVMASILTDAPLGLRAAAPDLPVALENVLAAVLEKDPSRRMSSARALSDALAQFAKAEDPTTMATLVGMPAIEVEAPQDAAATSAAGGELGAAPLDGGRAASSPGASAAPLAAAAPSAASDALSPRAKRLVGVALAVLLVGAIVGAVRRFDGKRGARGASAATGATFGDLLDHARAATEEQRRVRWRGCLLGAVDGSPELVAIAPEANVPKADGDLDAALAASPARPLTMAGPGDTSPPDAVRLIPLTPAPSEPSGASIPVLLVTERSLELGMLGGTMREPLTTDALRKRVRDELAADAPAWIVAVDRGVPLDQLRDALTLLEHAHGTVVLAVAAGASDSAAPLEAPDAPGMCRQAATEARPPTPAERGAYSEALGALAASCAERLPWVAGSTVRLRLRFEHGSAPLVCVERDDAMSPGLRRCLLDGARDLPAVDVPAQSLRGFATNVAIPGRKMHALCGAQHSEGDPGSAPR